MITRETLDNGVRLVTEAMPHVRSVSIGLWLTRGSRHEPGELGGIAHFVEHMLFKGTETRSAQDIAQSIDSVGGQFDAFTSKEYAGYYIKVLDEHLPVALELLADVVLRPALAVDDIEREKRVILEEIKMVEDTPDDLVHEIFTEAFWEGHPLGRPILGLPDTVSALDRQALRRYFDEAYVAENFIVAAAGNLEHARIRDLVTAAFGTARHRGPRADEAPPQTRSRLTLRRKELEQCHVCLGTPAYPQSHEGRYTLYVLNTLLGGSMSSRLFQNIRERRGLVYAIFSGLNAFRDAGMFNVYAGCAAETVREVIDLTIQEMRAVATERVPDDELRRAKDHLKGNLMLSLESTSSRMTHLARQDLYFDRFYTLDETLDSIEAVSGEDVLRVASQLFAEGAVALALLGPTEGIDLPREPLAVV
jgi:predicted Zn-dependent peptidase